VRTLRNLARDGLVDRTILSEFLVRVEYVITAEEQELLRLTAPVYVWLIDHRKNNQRGIYLIRHHTIFSHNYMRMENVGRVTAAGYWLTIFGR
jgi:DNA-binding HxlR family transcriptional regulator